MLEKSFSILSHLKKPKFYKNGDPFQLYIRITVDGSPTEISTKRTWDINRWNKRSGRASGTKEEAKALNIFIDTMIAKIHDARRHLIDANKEITAMAIKNILLGVDDRKLILREFRAHNDQVKALIGVEYSGGTLDLFERTLLHVGRFMQWQYKAEDMDIRKLDYEFISQFSFWLKTERKCQHNTTIKYLTYFKKIVLLCVKRRWLRQDPFAEFSLAKKETDRPFLTDKELTALSQKEFSTDRLSIVRDIFLFSCFTGLAYADVVKLKRSEIIYGIDGEEWISTNRQKTNSASKVPLLPVSLQILNKYADHPACKTKGTVLPILSNQKMNAYLKEIADTCGIQKNLSFHIARHTFATTVTLSKGVPIESVSKMLGHKNLKQTQHYAKILDVKVSSDMLLLKKRLQLEV
jgi:site-specific recombinase XerD